MKLGVILVLKPALVLGELLMVMVVGESIVVGVLMFLPVSQCLVKEES